MRLGDAFDNSKYCRLWTDFVIYYRTCETVWKPIHVKCTLLLSVRIDAQINNLMLVLEHYYDNL